MINCSSLIEFQSHTTDGLYAITDLQSTTNPYPVLWVMCNSRELSLETVITDTQLHLYQNYRSNKCTWKLLTHLPQDKMDAISQTTFSSAFSWMKMFENRLKFPKGTINNILALLQIMAWRRPGGKPLSEPMMGSLSTHICVTQPQWVKAHCILVIRLSFKWNIAAIKFYLSI